MALILRSPAAPATPAPLFGARVGGLKDSAGFTGESLVQACFPVGAGDPLEYTIGGVEADVFPITRDVVTGEPDTVRAVALVPNPSGRWTIPGAANQDGLISVAKGPGFPAAATLKPCNLEGLTIRTKVPGVPGTLEAKPFEAGHVSILQEEDRRVGRYIKQTRTLCTLVRTGFTTITEKTDSVLLALVIRTTRADFRAENLEVVILNGKWSAADDAYEVSEAGDGPVKFGYVQLLGYEEQDSCELFCERPTVHSIVLAGQPNEYVNLVNTLPGWPNAWHGLYPGSYFARRMVVYRTDEVSQPIARDICRRKDFTWAEGDIGYCNGKWAGYATVARFLKLPPIRGGFGSAAEALNQYANEREADMRAYVQTGVLQNDPDGLVQAGWSKPAGLRDPRGPGENDLDLMWIESPAPAHWSRLILQTDAVCERHHLAQWNLDTGREATIRDITLPDGRLPYGYDGTNVQLFYRSAHMRYISLPAPAFADVGILAPLDLPWNEVPVGDEEPNKVIHNNQDAPFGNWNSPSWSHGGRYLGPVKAAFYAMDDAVAEMSLRFGGLAALAGWCNREPREDGPFSRWTIQRLTFNMKGVVANQLSQVERGKGWWPNWTRGTPREPSHAWAMIVTLFHMADDDTRAYMTGDGDPDYDWFKLVATLIDHVTTENGLFTVWQDYGSATYNGDPPNLVTREGATPGRDGQGTDQKWSNTQIFHHVYLHQSLPLILERIASYAGFEGHLDKLIKCTDTMSSSAEVTRPDGYAGWPPYMHGSIGTEGLGNPPMTLEQARGVDGFWFSQGSLGFKPWSCFACVPVYHKRFGSWDQAINMAKRQFGSPSQISDSDLLRRLWEFLVEDPYRGFSPSRYKHMVLNLIGSLQATGITHPDFPDSP